jgi:hypothetical protein
MKRFSYQTTLDWPLRFGYPPDACVDDDGHLEDCRRIVQRNTVVCTSWEYVVLSST